MKKILLWVGVSVGFFIALVVIIFIALSYVGSTDKNMLVSEVIVDESLSSKMLKQKQESIDSLTVRIKNLKSTQFFSDLEKDSLRDQINFKDALIEGYKKSIDNLNVDLLIANKKAISIKELAKTYETMKADEMKPILKNVDDETVIAIYKNMSSRSRKTILKALSYDRAALITQRLAGVQTG